ncbi:alpha/beta hydrolase [Promicromonospora sukumoe]|uniref:alpha/beta hydrolase n=1 Tax=Promicromonospora sukumoe TaxID=88382 RepID=UPI0003613ED0|nr:alpha/beta hydrolase-fold protein [Promicromonospora sukumoe]
MTAAVPFRPLPAELDDVRYELGPDSRRRPDVPPGETVELRLTDSAVYPGTTRTVWIHVPAAHDPADPADPDPARPAGLLLFQDGWWYLDPDGDVRGGIVLDNLVHDGAIPPTIGVFVDPGIFPDRPDPVERKNRNTEYDAADDRYATFLLTEVIPEVRRRYAVTDDPDRWGIVGGSSGGNCAFTAAWHRPDRFRRVVGFLSSFAQMPGGNPYPSELAAEPRKPLRIFLQAGHRDLGWDRPERNWLAENLRVGAALAEAGYDFRLVLGDGGHNPNHAGVLLPDALRWAWRDAAPAAPTTEGAHR